MSEQLKLTPNETRQVKEAMGLNEAEAPPKKTSRDSACEAYAEAKGALRSAERAARRNDFVNAKKWTELAERLTAAAEKLAAMPPPVSSWEEEDAMRAELIQRFDRLGGDDAALNQWQLRHEIWTEMAAEAERTGGPMPPPMPPRPPHWMDALPEDLRQRLEDAEA